MLSKEFLDLLRCPMDPQRDARLEEVENSLVCQRCRLTFAIKEGLPSLIVEEAALPSGCESLADLPCQKAPAPAGSVPEASA